MLKRLGINDIPHFITRIAIILILAAIFLLAVKFTRVENALNHPTIATTATNHITVNAGGHIWLYDGGKYDIKAEPGAIIHDSGG